MPRSVLSNRPVTHPHTGATLVPCGSGHVAEPGGNETEGSLFVGQPLTLDFTRRFIHQIETTQDPILSISGATSHYGLHL